MGLLVVLVREPPKENFLRHYSTAASFFMPDALHVTKPSAAKH